MSIPIGHYRQLLEIHFKSSKAYQKVINNTVILRDETMNDKLIHIPNYHEQIYPLCRLKLFVEKLRHHNFGTDQFEFNKSTSF